MLFSGGFFVCRGKEPDRQSPLLSTDVGQHPPCPIPAQNPQKRARSWPKPIQLLEAPTRAPCSWGSANCQPRSSGAPRAPVWPRAPLGTWGFGSRRASVDFPVLVVFRGEAERRSHARPAQHWQAEWAPVGFLGNTFGWMSACVPSLFLKIQIVVLRLGKRDGRTHQQPPLGAGSSQHAKPGLHRVKKK